MKHGRVVVSVVSHAHSDLVAKLLDDLNRSCARTGSSPFSVARVCRSRSIVASPTDRSE